MRRFCSITMLVLLLGSALSSGWAATDCGGTGVRMLCHRHSMTMRHCEMMEGQAKDGEGMSNGEDSVAIELAGPTKCPMQCCMRLSAGKNAVASLGFMLSPLSAGHGQGSLFSAIFSSPGFSSHTDRGPPAL